MDKMNEIKEKYKQHDELKEQLFRQLSVEKKYGIKAHKISKIRLVPSDRNALSNIEYSSLVTMNNGDKIHIPNVNIKKLLDEGVEQ